MSRRAFHEPQHERPAISALGTRSTLVRRPSEEAPKFKVEHLRRQTAPQIGSRPAVAAMPSLGLRPMVRRRGPGFGKKQHEPGKKYPGGDKHGPPFRRSPFGPKQPPKHHPVHPPVSHHPVSRGQHKRNSQGLIRKLFNQLQGGGGLSGGYPGDTVIPPTGGAGGGVSPVLVIGGLSVAAVVALIIYEWYRHKHKKEEARA